MMASAVARWYVMKWMLQALSWGISCSSAAQIHLKLVAGSRPPRPAPISGKPSEASGGVNRGRSLLASANAACTAWVMAVGRTS